MTTLSLLLASLWMLEVERTDDPAARHDWIFGDEPSVENVRGREGVLPIAVRLSRRTADGETVWSGTVENRTTNWLVHCVSVRPFVRKVPDDFEAVYYPGGLGLRYRRLPKATDGDVSCGWERLGGADRKRLYAFRCNWPVMPGRYPSYRTTMTWCAMAGRTGGVYWGCHNPRMESVYPRPLYDPARREMVFSADFDAMLGPGRTWNLPPVVEADYRGTWHEAAKRYRRWFQGVQKPIDDPPLGLTGQLLCILKQQNGEIIWPYAELDRLGDAALAHGLNWVGLFGWTVGGHDHLYPDYDPDPAMGGREALKEGIRALHARGLKCYIYANGQLQEQGATAFWRETGRHQAVQRANGTTWTETWHKYSDAPPHVFDLGCLYSEAWYRQMKKMALQANELGADGILYDQLGNSPPRPCYGRGHGHDGPAMCFADDTVRFLSRLRREMREVNPSFTLHSEGVGDSYSDSIDFYHGMSTGAHPYMCMDNVKRRLAGGENDGPDIYPELFRYTFPRIVSTSRMPSPFLTRDCVNYDMIFGLRHDIEIRYTPDRRFVETGKVPALAEYGTVLGPPSLDLMAGIDQRAARDYLKAVCDFQRTWAKYLLFGDYRDTEGVDVRGEGLAARRFEASDGTSAVLVWNVSAKPVRPVFAKPVRPSAAASPGEGPVGVDAPVPANALRLYVFSDFRCDLDGAALKLPERPGRPLFLVDDAADDAPWREIREGGEAFGVSLEVTRERKNGAEFLDVTVRGRSRADRALTVVYAVPVADGADAEWLRDPYVSLPFYGAELRNTSDLGCGRNGVSKWPFGAVRSGGRCTALGIDPSAPAVFRTAASPRAGLLFLACDVALTAERNEARFRIVSFTSGAGDGFRGVLGAYRSLFPYGNEVRIAKHGLWMPFKPIGGVKDWEDFGFAVKEGDKDVAWDDAHGVLTFHYTEPTSWWMHYKPASGAPTLEGARAEAERLAASGDWLGGAWRTGAYRKEDGTVFGELHKRVWCTGALWCLSPLPAIPGGEYSVKLDETSFAKRHADPFPRGVDGEYIDSCERPWMTPALDFNRANFRFASTPLCWSPETRKPALATVLAVSEYVKAAAERVHGRGKLMMANGTPGAVPWVAPFVDMCGSETRWLTPRGRWMPPDRTELVRLRALSGGKPFCFVQNGNFGKWTDELVEKYMARSLAFGILSGFCSDDAGGGDYFTRPELYERHRSLFRKYVPLQRRLSEAGWRPVGTLLRTDDDAVSLEQFGDGLVAVFNFAAEARSVRLEPLSGRTGADELVTGEKVSFPAVLAMRSETVRVFDFHVKKGKD